MYYVYILWSKLTGYTYKGFTNDLNRRLLQHAHGENKFTKRYLPMNLIHVEICETQTEARSIEKFFKSGYGREIIKELLETE